MTITVSGFLANGLITNNDQDQVATFGEISNYCRTFSKDIQLYSNETWPGIEALIFESKNDVGNALLNQGHIDRILEVAGWLYQSSTAFPPNFSKNDVVAQMQTRFADSITEIAISDLQSDGFRRQPTRLTFTLILQGLEDCRVTLWTSNSTFEAEYSSFRIDVLSPVTSLDDLFKPYAAVQQLATKRTPIETMAAIEALKNKKPSTMTVAVSTVWTDPANSANRVDFTWYVNIYGPAGNTSDNINTALLEYIAAHSTNDVTSWKVVLPDLFRNTHFVVLPRWDKIAIPFRTGVDGLYSPVMSLRESRTFAISKLTAWSPTQIDNTVSLTYHPYRSIALVIAGGPDNRAGAKIFEEHIKDYIGQESIAGNDFTRQSELTQAWVSMMGNLLRAAEKQVISSPPPSGMRMFRRDGITYLSQKLDNVEYLVAIKANYGA